MRESLKKTRNRIIEFSERRRLFLIVSVISSISVSMMEKKVFRIKWDGCDYRYRWNDGCLYFGRSLERVSRHDEEFSFFTYFYLPKMGDVVVDIGAGVGTETVNFSKLVGPSGHVFAIEPDPVAARRLRKAVSELPYKNVTILELAIGDKNEDIAIYSEMPGAIQTSIFAYESDFSLLVEGSRLDSLFQSHILDKVDFIKMNIEGAEIKALDGLGAESAKVMNIVVSCHDFLEVEELKTFEKTKNLLRDLRFQTSLLPSLQGNQWRNFLVFGSKPS
jgi:FkbM family methyltransferase